MALGVVAATGCGGSGQRAASAPHSERSGTSERTGTTAPTRHRREPASRTVRAYVDAVNARAGERLCALLAPGAVDPLPLRRRSSGCARALEASIGRPGKHGEPAWRSCRLVAVRPARYENGIARVTISLRHRLAGSEGEVPVEQDVVYLRPSGRAWSVVKASGLLFRAVGVGNVPLGALQPPSAG